MKKILSIILIVISSVTLLSGCKNNKSKESGVTNIESSNKQEDKTSQTETPYYILDGDNITYLTEDSFNIQELKTTLTEFADTMYTRDYQTIKGNEEYTFYTEEFKNKLIKEDDIKSTVQTFKDNKLIRESKGINEFYKVQLNKDKTEAIIEYQVIIAFLEFSDDSKYAKAGIIPNQYYQMRNSASLKLENGSWKISSTECGKVLKFSDEDETSLSLPTKIENLNTIYGKHTYGCKTQEEYDEVVKIIDEFVSNLSDEDIKNQKTWLLYEIWLKFKAGEDVVFEEYVEKYGNINNAYPDNPTKEWQLSYASFLGSMNAEILNEKIGDDEFENAVKLDIIIDLFSSKYMRDVTYDTENVSQTSSAYEILFNKKNDMYSNAQIKMAILDKLGYNTALINSKKEYNWAYVKLGNYWWNIPRFSSYEEKISDFDKTIFNVYEEPTYDITNS